MAKIRQELTEDIQGIDVQFPSSKLATEGLANDVTSTLTQYGSSKFATVELADDITRTLTQYGFLSRLLSLLEYEGYVFSATQASSLSKLLQVLEAGNVYEDIIRIICPLIAKTPTEQRKLYLIANQLQQLILDEGEKHEPLIPQEFEEDPIAKDHTSDQEETPVPDISLDATTNSESALPLTSTANTHFDEELSDDLVAALEACSSPPYSWNLDLPNDPNQLVDYEEALGQTLVQMRGREQVLHQTLDLAATIHSTIESGGQVKLQYYHASRPAEYLILIEKNSVGNHQAAFFDQLAHRFKQEEVFIERFYYYGDPRICRNEDFPQGIPLAKLHYRHFEARLIIIGAGHRFLSFKTGGLAPNLRILMRWNFRVLLTPIRQANWDKRERLLTSVFSVLPAVPESLFYLAQSSAAGAPGTVSKWPTYLSNALGPQLTLKSVPVIPFLRVRFDQAVLAWIAACAIYPKLHYELTLSLGRIVAEELDERLLTSTKLGQLSRISWFSIGHIPEGIRDELIAFLEESHPNILEKAVAFLRDTLKTNPPPSRSVAWAEHRMNLALLHAASNPAELTSNKELRTVVKYLAGAPSRTKFVVPRTWAKVLEQAPSSPNADLANEVTEACSIFLSHATHDDDFVQSLRQALESQGIPAWTDSRELRPGDMLSSQIHQAIDQADYFLLIFSQHTIQSRWVKRELDYAKAQDKRIVTLLLDAQTTAMLAWLFEEEPVAVPVSTAPGGLEHAMPAILTTLGQRLSEDVLPMEAAPEPPVNELCLVLAEPKLYTEGGKRRGQARAYFELEPGDGSGLVETRRFDFICPLGPIEAGRMKWYIEEYPQAPFLEKILHRGAALEEDLASWGKLLFNSLTDHTDARELVWTWKGEQVHERRFSVRFDLFVREEPSAEDREAMNILMATPWEILHDGQAWLFQGKKPVRIRRRLPNRSKKDKIVLQDKLRVLLLSPRPVDESANYIDHRVTPQALLSALEPLGNRAELVLLNRPTYRDMCAAIKAADEAGRPFSVVHFDGHGVFDPNRGLGALCFESSEGKEQIKLTHRKTHIVYANDLLAELRGYRIPLFFLDACQSAVAEKDATASVPANLLETGVASVVAMSYSVLVSTAAIFAKAFYAALAQGSRIGTAMLAGQRALHDDPVRAEFTQGEKLRLQDWFVPVLFQEQDDPQLVRYLPSQQASSISTQARVARAGAVPSQPHGGHRFVGRKRELLKFERLLLLEPWAAIIGSGGTGKTALAAELAQWLLRTGRFQRLAFVSFEYIRDVPAMLDSLGRQLIGNDFSVMTYADVEKAWQQLEQRLKEAPSLILFDNLSSVQPLLDERVNPGIETFDQFLAAFQRLLSAETATRLLFTSRESLPAPFNQSRQVHRLGALRPADALHLVAEVMRTAGIELASLNVEDLEQQFGAMARSANYHARALTLLAHNIASRDEQSREQLLRFQTDYGDLMAELEQRSPGERENSLYASMELSLRRLPEEVRERVAVLAVYHGGVDIATWAMVADCEQDETAKAAMALVQVGLAELKVNEFPYYFQLDPALSAWLAQQASAEQLAGWGTRWREGMVALTNFLYEQKFRSSHLINDLVLLQEANLLAMLRTLAEEATPEQIIGVTENLEDLYARLSRPAVVNWIKEIRREAATHIDSWSHAQFTHKSAQVDRLLERGNLQGAFELAKQVWEQCVQAGTEAYAEAAYDGALAHWRLARVLKVAGQVEQSVTLLQEAQRRFQSLESEGNESAARLTNTCLTEMGDCLVNLGQYEAATQCYEESIQRAEMLADTRQVAISKGQLANVYRQQKDYPEALRLYEETKEFFVRSQEVRAEAVTWSQIGRVQQEAENYVAAERAYQTSLGIHIRQKNRIGEAASLRHLGDLSYHTSKFEDAIRIFEKVAEIYRELGDVWQEGVTCNYLAAALMKLDRHDEARSQLQRAIECNSQLGHAAVPWQTWNTLYELELAGGNQEAATLARSKAIESYAAYRQDGGESRSNRYQLLSETANALQEGKENEVKEYLESSMKNDDLPDYTALGRVLLAILSDSQKEGLLEDPALHYMDVIDLRLMFFQE